MRAKEDREGRIEKTEGGKEGGIGNQAEEKGCSRSYMSQSL